MIIINCNGKRITSKGNISEFMRYLIHEKYSFKVDFINSKNGGF